MKMKNIGRMTVLINLLMSVVLECQDKHLSAIYCVLLAILIQLINSEK